MAEKKKELEDIEGEECEDVYISREELRRPNIKLIETYLEFINDSEISSEDLYDRFNHIYLEVHRYINLRNINEEERELGVKIIQTICKNLLRRKERNLINKFLEILYGLSKIDIFIKPLKSNCLNTFLQFYKEKNYYSYLIDILDNCGYFTNVEKEILHAIDDRNYDLLKKFEAIAFSAYKREGTILTKALQSKHKEINNSEEPELKEVIRNIMKKIENAMFF